MRRYDYGCTGTGTDEVLASAPRRDLPFATILAQADSATAPVGSPTTTLTGGTRLTGLRRIYDQQAAFAMDAERLELDLVGQAGSLSLLGLTDADHPSYPRARGPEGSKWRVAH